MKVEVTPDAESAGRRAAAILAPSASETLAERERFVLAVSGGKTPEPMFRSLSEEAVHWSRVHVIQVDERVAPDGHRDRNWTGLMETLLSRVPLKPEHLHPMPVEARDLEAAARGYAGLLRELAGDPPAIDCVHLGLGADGHTASFVLGDPILDCDDADVGLTGIYHGWRRMTLTYPALNRARRLVWLVTGTSKADVLERLLRGDRTIPAGQVRGENVVVVADAAAARRGAEKENGP